MGYFKLLNKLFPASPDQILKKATDAEAAVARMAHVNTIVNDLSDIAHYEIDASQTLTIPVNTNKGILDIVNWDTVVPDVDWHTSTTITLTNNPILNIANRDLIYLQVTPYYNRNGDSDTFIPYILTTGFLDGLNITVWNANPDSAGPNEGEGAFYIYYEVKYLG